MQLNFREIWYHYRSEVVFFIALCGIVALSTYLSRFIPEAVFDNTITPILISATVATAFIGAWLMHLVIVVSRRVSYSVGRWWYGAERPRLSYRLGSRAQAGDGYGRYRTDRLRTAAR